MWDRNSEHMNTETSKNNADALQNEVNIENQVADEKNTITDVSEQQQSTDKSKKT